MDSTKPEKQKTDILCLMIGKKVSMFFSQLNFIADSMFKADIGDNPLAIQEWAKSPDLKKKYSRPGFYSNYQLFINYPENKVTVTDQIASNKFIYEEAVEKINWEILPDTLRLLNYHCQKAEALFRGRKYEAWFTSELPINSGPYKFQGLPGFIVKINDLRNNYTFECISFEQLNTKQPIIIQEEGYLKTTRKEFRKAFQASFENPYQTITAGGNVTISGGDADKLKAILQKGFPYNPIELE